LFVEGRGYKRQIKPRFESDGRSDNDDDSCRCRGFNKRRQPLIVFDERQVVGETYFIARQRQLREHHNLRPFRRGDPGQADVFVDV
jgi:hypothetical protein